jgi:hypothetical protein
MILFGPVTLTQNQFSALSHFHFTFPTMWHGDHRYENAKCEIFRLVAEHPNAAAGIQTQIAKLLKNLRDGGPGASKYQIRERSLVTRRRSGFDLRNSEAFQYFEHMGWDRLPYPTIRGIVQVVAFRAEIGHLFDRDAKREKSLLFKWLDQYWDLLRPQLEHAQLEITFEQPRDSA